MKEKKHSLITLLWLLKGIAEECYISNQTNTWFIELIETLFPAGTKITIVSAPKTLIKVEYQNYCFVFRMDNNITDTMSKQTYDSIIKIGNGPLLKK